jgi:hypothetical protein
MISEIFERFVEQTPVTVMVRAIMERSFAPEQLEKLFEDTRPSAIYEKANVFKRSGIQWSMFRREIYRYCQTFRYEHQSLQLPV